MGAERFWDFISKSADKPYTSPSKTTLRIAENTSAYLSDSDTVLDFGCGPGNITLEIAPKVSRMYGIDISKGMIDAARHNASHRSVMNTNFEKISIFDPKLEKGSFNAILAFNVLHFIDDMPGLLERISELLIPGGYFISSTACIGEKKSVFRILLFLLTSIRILPKMKFYKTTSLEKVLENGGFEILLKQNLTNIPDHYIVARNLASPH